MTSDLELIKQLKKEIRKNLEERTFEEIGGYRKRGYAIGKNGDVVGLNLEDSELKPVPVSLSKFHHLKKLSLYKTDITDISFLQGLSNLTLLDLSSNKITDISFLQGLSNLTRLDLINNQIKELPEALVELGLEIDVDELFTWGQKIYLYKNPLEKPPLEIIRNGIPAIKAYFQSLKKETNLPLNEVKVLLVGDGAAGKTSLVKQMRGQDFNKNESQTHGINIDSWEVNQDETKIKVRLWDFGGQEIMHATH